MAEEKWRPLWARHGREMEYDALAPGVPAHLTEGLIEWLNCTLVADDGIGGVNPRKDVLQDIEVQVRVPLDWSHGTEHAHGALLDTLKADGELFLSVVDWVLMTFGKERVIKAAVDSLENLLRSGGSAWMVAPDGRSLIHTTEPRVSRLSDIERLYGILYDLRERLGRHCLKELWRW